MVFAILACLFAVAIGALPMTLRHLVLKDISPTQRKRMEDGMSKPLHFPAEWAEVKPFSAELRREAEDVGNVHSGLTTVTDALRESSTTLLLARLMHDAAPATDDQWTSLSAILEASRQYLVKLEHLGAREDYEYEALAPVHDGMFGAYNDSMIIVTTRYVCALNIEDRLRARDPEGAVAGAFILPRLMQRHPAAHDRRAAAGSVYYAAN